MFGYQRTIAGGEPPVESRGVERWYAALIIHHIIFLGRAKAQVVMGEPI
jgi:hypothetical protein